MPNLKFYSIVWVFIYTLAFVSKNLDAMPKVLCSSALIIGTIYFLIESIRGR